MLSLAPPDLELPITLTDLNHHCWVVSGSSVMQDGNTIINGYGVDLDNVAVGTKVGVMRKSDATFHVFVNGEDKGTAASLVPPGRPNSLRFLLRFSPFDGCEQCLLLLQVCLPPSTCMASVSRLTLCRKTEQMLNLLSVEHLRQRVLSMNQC